VGRRSVFLVLALLLFSTTVFAEDDGGFFSSLISGFKKILGMLFGGGGDGGATTAAPFCQKPYFEFSPGECCLDLDENRVCDSQQTTTTVRQTTTLAPATTSAPTTTTVKITTTTLSKIKCRVNSDCGEYHEEKVCYNEDVYIQRVSYTCRNPGTVESECIEKRIFEGQSAWTPPSPHKTCGSRGCKDGECL